MFIVSTLFLYNVFLETYNPQEKTPRHIEHNLGVFKKHYADGQTSAFKSGTIPVISDIRGFRHEFFFSCLIFGQLI